MSWFADARGNIVMLYALALIPIVGVAGFAMDMNRQKTVQIRIQAALDTAVLTVARESVNSDLDKDALEAMARNIFAEALSDTGSISIGEPVLTETDGIYNLSVSGSMPTAVMGVLGKPDMPIGKSASAAASAPDKLEMALVLDNSGSMDGSKIDALKSAAAALVNDLVKPDAEHVKVAIVPFNNYVNVGLGNLNQSWLDVPSSYTSNYETCTVDHDASIAAGCALVANTCTNEDGDTYACTTWQCPDGVDPVLNCTPQSATASWWGCVYSRPAPYNVEDRSYHSQKVPADLDFDSWYCPQPVTPLTSDVTTLTTAISSLKAESSTFIGTGLTWGLRVLTPAEPFSEGALFAAPACNGSNADICDPDHDGTNPMGTSYQGFDRFVQQGGVRVLVLMSDGKNTRGPDYWSGGGNHWADDEEDVDLANTITADVCDEIKSYGIELYTIAFEVTDTDLKDLLRGCASSPNHFFDAGNTSSLLASFSKIGKAYSPIALVE